MAALRFQTGGQHLTFLSLLQGKQNSTRKQYGHNAEVTRERETETETETDRQTDRQTEIVTEKETQRATDRQTDRQRQRGVGINRRHTHRDR